MAAGGDEPPVPRDGGGAAGHPFARWARDLRRSRAGRRPHERPRRAQARAENAGGRAEFPFLPDHADRRRRDSRQPDGRTRQHLDGARGLVPRRAGAGAGGPQQRRHRDRAGGGVLRGAPRSPCRQRAGLPGRLRRGRGSGRPSPDLGRGLQPGLCRC